MCVSSPVSHVRTARHQLKTAGFSYYPQQVTGKFLHHADNHTNDKCLCFLCNEGGRRPCGCGMSVEGQVCQVAGLRRQPHPEPPAVAGRLVASGPSIHADRTAIAFQCPEHGALVCNPQGSFNLAFDKIKVLLDMWPRLVMPKTP